MVTQDIVQGHICRVVLLGCEVDAVVVKFTQVCAADDECHAVLMVSIVDGSSFESDFGEVYFGFARGIVCYSVFYVSTLIPDLRRGGDGGDVVYIVSKIA